MADKMREEFEEWVLKDWARSALLRRNQPGHPKDGENRSTATEMAWQAWQEKSK